MKDTIAIRATHRHPRLRYIAKVFSQWWPLKVIVHTKETIEGPSIDYGTSGKGISIQPDAFMSGKLDIDMSGLSLDRSFKNFDPLAVIFWYLSRYEEYMPSKKDEHGRFTASSSLSYKLGFLDQPVAVLLADRLYRLLREKYPRLPPNSRSFELKPTYDVDMAWAFRARGWRGFARTALDIIQGKWPLFRARLASLGDANSDPFYTFNQLSAWHAELGLKPHYFFLLASNRSKYDPNTSPAYRPLRALIQQLDNLPGHHIGIHPSYQTMQNEYLVAEEVQTLKTIIEQGPFSSRQHYLRLRLPDTYRALIRAGLQSDYSMGYADMPGWRAGTHLPFPWYDLEKEKSTHLQIHPFAFMDVTLKNYQHLSASDALQRMMFYRNQVESLGGPLYSLWHNSSFSEAHGWAEYGETYERYLRGV